MVWTLGHPLSKFYRDSMPANQDGSFLLKIVKISMNSLKIFSSQTAEPMGTKLQCYVPQVVPSQNFIWHTWPLTNQDGCHRKKIFV